jgi:hypothetical protein
MIMGLNTIKEFQDNGGIVITILACLIFISVVRALDWLVWRKELKAVSLKSSNDVGQHELNYHFEETLRRANKDRRSGKHKTWTGEERRMA